MINDKQRIVHLATKLAYLAKHVGNDVSESTLTDVHDQLEKMVDEFPRISTEAPPTVAAYFLDQLGAQLEDDADTDHPASPAHPEFTVETGCGEDCKQAIDAGAAFVEQIRAAYGNDRPDLIQQIREHTADAVREVVRCFVYG